MDPPRCLESSVGSQAVQVLPSHSFGGSQQHVELGVLGQRQFGGTLGTMAAAQFEASPR